MANKRNRRQKRQRRKLGPDGSAGQANDTSAANGADTTAAPQPDSPPGESSPAEPNPYGPDAKQGPLETAEDVRAAGLSVEVPFEAPTAEDADIQYADGRSFFQRFPDLLKSNKSV